MSAKSCRSIFEVVSCKADRTSSSFYDSSKELIFAEESDTGVLISLVSQVVEVSNASCNRLYFVLSLLSNDLLCCNLESEAGLNHMIHVDHNCQQKNDGFLLQVKLSKARLLLVAEIYNEITITS